MKLLMRMRRSWKAWLLALLLSPFALIVLGRWIDPPLTAFMMQRYVQAWSEGQWQFRIRHQWYDWEELSPHLAVAVIAAEDQRFAEHWGFDVQQMQAAWQDWRAGERLRGASTLSQQLAKNLFLWSGQSWLRKVLEVPLTLAIELTWSKGRILEVYLNVVEFGDGVYGVGAASQHFYRQSPAQLSRAQAARLAAVLPNPKRFKAQAPSAYVLKRQTWIQRQMANLGGTSLHAQLAP
ncbi:monofunctional biosynthetic peptidoglycan transglycosylase [Balneatrix alpica]|uniref:monofunctional biosynthetic peptidoglycan transglycosylase n=1 Tax=Balneatrix alpica TaxID=75684 RepID=UPI0027387AF5|nr:monofunctional biosynthetic peptidoglycan transglycosylase [Balneatrix alpica]